MSWRTTISATFLGVAAGATYGHEQTAMYRYPGGVDVVAFDGGRVGIKDLGRYMQLSPALSPYNYMLIPETLESCKAGDSRYRNCGRQGVDFDKHNAMVNLTDISKRIKELKQSNYPAALSVVVRFFAAIQSFSLKSRTQELDFLTRGDVKSLESKIDSVDPAVACKAVIEKIRRSPSEQERSELVRFDWTNCVWFAEQAYIGPYPENSWKSFSDEFKLKEQITEESPD